jgi:glycosyltransferase involved in cell wall biosynthesis
VFTRRLDGVISLSAAGVDALRDAFPALARVPTFVVPHGHYRAAYPAPVPRAAARRALDLPPDAPVILHFGVLRPYKNVVRLVEAFRAMDAPEGDGAAPALLVAGTPGTAALADAVRAAADGAARVRLDLRFVPDEAVPRYLGAADLVALPYAEILNSGTALLALSLDRPVLVPDRGAMGELRGHAGAAWVRTYAPPLTPTTLADALAWARHADRPARPDLSALAWPRLAADTHAAFEAVVAGGRRR